MWTIIGLAVMLFGIVLVSRPKDKENTDKEFQTDSVAECEG